MSGHSKWANIKHRKERSDARKGKEFTRVAKEIINAVKQGGADIKSNSKLRLAIQKAKDVNMPNENVERNIKKASSADQADYTQMFYELYGHGGVGIILDIMTDNKNRISSDIRIATNKCGGRVANPGAVTFNFDRKGVILVDKTKAIEDEIFALATDAGAEDFEAADEDYIITTSVEDLLKVKDQLEKKEVEIKEASLEFISKVQVSCSKEDQEANSKLLEWLENLDDVDNVYHNMEITE